jgi:hypothetical protein
MCPLMRHDLHAPQLAEIITNPHRASGVSAAGPVPACPGGLAERRSDLGHEVVPGACGRGAGEQPGPFPLGTRLLSVWLRSKTAAVVKPLGRRQLGERPAARREPGHHRVSVFGLNEQVLRIGRLPVLLPRRAQVQDEVRHARLSDQANLDEGTMWPTDFALTELTAADEARIGALVEKSSELKTEPGRRGDDDFESGPGRGPPPAGPAYQPVLAQPVLRRLLPAFAASAVGDGMSAVAIAWLAIWRMLTNYVGSGSTVLFSSHVMEFGRAGLRPRLDHRPGPDGGHRHHRAGPGGKTP